MAISITAVLFKEIIWCNCEYMTHT